MAEEVVSTEPASMASSPRLPLLDTQNLPESPTPIRQGSAASYESPRRHQHRQATLPRQVKETLNARSEYTTSQDDGTAQHHINQYIIKQEMGRGSFGAVHLAVDQYGGEYAVKEFSKARLRKRQQSHMLRQPRGPRRPGTGFNSPLHRHPTGSDDANPGHPLDLIKEEIAIMKKLYHSNLVSLIEVLDDPTEDSLYMVMEMCKKGVIMKVGLEQKADPYDDEKCRLWFRDLILGIEYLHAQGIAHRDIKPDNCLLTGDNVLKVVDFGVSEMFAKDSDMYTAKSAGSPAFLPPELCVAKHGDVSGKAADIWSMGVTLYCLRYGRIPFEKQSIFELYESIRNDPFTLEGETDDIFKDLMHRILEKDPAKRITMQELRNHPWVTKNGADPLLSEEENTAQLIEPPTEEEMNTAITNNLQKIFVVMKAVQKFKKLVDPAKHPHMHSILGLDDETHLVQPPMEMEADEGIETLSTYKRVLRDRKSHPHHPEHPQSSSGERGRSPRRHGSTVSLHQAAATAAVAAAASHVSSSREDTPSGSASEGTRGHARDPLEEEHLFLNIGPSTFSGLVKAEHDDYPPSSLPIPIPDPSTTSISEYTTTTTTTITNSSATASATTTEIETTTTVPEDFPIVSESPGASEIDIYETAYREEIERIKRRSIARRDTSTIYLTRRVEDKKYHLDEVMKLLQHPSPTTQNPNNQFVGGRLDFS
ncbi:uncharacterized protein TRUGW13939_07995 [Talaromyces rugulosus]|uniref:Protein kinase domain-containing protein n=1 Tax=Talaromyces rugulosus TaxID=121627 RepID=A0A7H8R389_TALRU|nr:uncharacterized protein TRUGW13939_07995 [Talaromyces rugulosus]QKX60849.1 hypothetical protein TRUGW13939_07995 [Talaromyces rugulosus]